MTGSTTTYAQVDVAIVTALHEELEPVLRLIGQQADGRITPYFGQIETSSGTVTVAATTENKTGGDGIIRAIFRVLQLQPRLIAMTGICAGPRKKVRLGDLIIAEFAFHEREGKDTNDGFMPDGRTYEPHGRTIDWAKELAAKNWSSKLGVHHPDAQAAYVLWYIVKHGPDIWSPRNYKAFKRQGIEVELIRDWLFQEQLLTAKNEITPAGNDWLNQRCNLAAPKIVFDGSALHVPRVWIAPAVQSDAVKALDGWFDSFHSRARKLLMCDMETASFYSTLKVPEHLVAGIVVKSVVDHADSKKDDRFHRYGSEAATQWLFNYVRYYAQHIRQLPRSGGPSLLRRDILDDAPLVDNNVRVERLELISQVRHALLSDASTVALTAKKAAPTALHGMGGIGKTWLAGRICEEKQIHDHFSSGIIWVKVGESPNLLDILATLVRRLIGDFNDQHLDPVWLKDRLEHYLQEGAFLLVLDDVWDYQLLERLPKGGLRCRRLITTRSNTIANLPETIEVKVDVLSVEQAMRLLEAAAKGTLAQSFATQKDNIINLLGCHPLAIRIAGYQVATYGLEEWLREFSLKELDNERPLDIPDGLFTVLKRSLVYLERDMGQGTLPIFARSAYIDLGIFKPDERVPIVAIERLWSVRHNASVKQSRNLLRQLADRHLLTLYGEPGEWQVELHDLLHDMVRRELGNQLQHAHAALLDAYRPPSRQWHEASDDGYLYDHLAYHLSGTDDWGSLRALFANDEWLQVRVRQRDWTYDGYLSDLELVWTRTEAEAKEQIEKDRSPKAIADCARYALIRSTINSLAANYEPALVSQAVGAGVWSLERALSLTKKISDPQQKAKMNKAILSVTGQEEVITVALQGKKDALPAFTETRAETISEPEYHNRTLVTQALGAAQAASDPEHRCRTLVALVPQLKGKLTLLAQALSVAQTINDPEYCSRALTALAPQLKGEPTLLAQALTIMQAISDPMYRSRALTALAPQLKGEPTLLAQAITGAQAISDPKYRNRDLVTLAPLLSSEPTLLVQALNHAHAISDKEWRQRALDALVVQNFFAEFLAYGHVISYKLYRHLFEGAFQAIAKCKTFEVKAQSGKALQRTHRPRFRLNVPARLYDVRQHMRSDLVRSLREQSNRERREVLELCADKKFVSPLLLPYTTRAQIAHTITEICEKWRWL